MYALFENIFPPSYEAYKPTGVFHCGTKSVQIGHSFLPINCQGQSDRTKSLAMEILHHSLEPLESLMKCVEMDWMAILVSICLECVFESFCKYMNIIYTLNSD